MKKQHRPQSTCSSCEYGTSCLLSVLFLDSLCRGMPAHIHLNVKRNKKTDLPSVLLKRCPRVPVPPFFHPLLRTGWCSAAACLPSPSVMDGGMTASTWTRAPFCEVWGKPESCRTLQETSVGYIICTGCFPVKIKNDCICSFRSHLSQLAQKKELRRPWPRLRLTNLPSATYNFINILFEITRY